MAFWESRHKLLGAVYEQLDAQHAKSIVALLKARSSDRNLLASFHSQHSELVRVRAQALCTRFLSCASQQGELRMQNQHRT